MKKIIALFLIMLFSAFAISKVPRVFVSVKQKDIKAGEKIDILIGAEVKKGSKVKFSTINTIGGVKVISKKFAQSSREIDINGKKEKLVKKYITFKIAPQKSFDIASFTIKIDNKDYKTVPFRVKVASSSKSDKKPQKQEIKKIDKPKKIDTKNKIEVENSKNVKKDIKRIKEKSKSSINLKNTIQKENNSSIADPKKFIFTMKSNKKDLSVGEEFIVKVTLVEPISLSGANLKYFPPKFNGFSAEPIGEGKIEERSDSLVRTIEYMVKANRAGKLKIKPARAEIGIVVTSQTQTPFGFFGADVDWRKLSTNSLEILVHKIPKDVDLVGKFKIETYAKSHKAKRNKPFKYTIKVIGIGNLDNFKLPKIEIGNITVYKEEPIVERKIVNGIEVSTLRQDYVFIANRDFTIPSIGFKLYNPDNKKTYNIDTKPFMVKLSTNNSISSILNRKGSSKSSGNPVSNISSSNKNFSNINSVENSELKKAEEILIDKQYYKRKFSSGYPLTTLIASLFLGILIGVALALLVPGFFRIKKGSNFSKERYFNSYEEALNTLYPHITKSKNIEKMVTNLYEVTNGNRDIVIDDYALNKMIKKIKNL